MIKLVFGKNLPPLIQRYIGDLWGAAKNPRKLAELEQLGQEIMEDKLL
jgi:hypothetical protein